MSEPSGIGVRITRAAPEADLEAVVWPDVSAVYYPRAESPAEIQAVARRIAEFERLRGIRPGTIGVIPLIESPQGVSVAGEIAAASDRIRVFGVGPNITLELGEDALDYARGKCELHARALGLQPLDADSIRD